MIVLSLLAPPKTVLITPESMPRPYAVRSTIAIPQIIRADGDPPLRVPPGFRIAAFARNLHHPRMLLAAPNGDVFVTDSERGVVLLLRDANGDGVAESRFVFAGGRRLPHGMALHGRWLYVADTDRVVRYRYEPGQTTASAPAETVVPDIPAKGRNQHWTRNIVFEPDGSHFLLGVGSASNKAVEPPPRAAITRYREDGTGRETFATGLRNPVGLVFRPGTEELWTTCVERDYMGDDVVPDFFTRVRKGQFFGWPWFYIGRHRDPRAPQGAPQRVLRGPVAVPDVLFVAHSVPLGAVFYEGANFPREYRGDVFVALRGSTNRSVSSGFMVARIRFRNGRPVGGYEPFVDGWLADARRHLAYGRPVGLAVMRDGSLLVGDEVGNTIWRVTWGGDVSL